MRGMWKHIHHTGLQQAITMAVHQHTGIARQGGRMAGYINNSACLTTRQTR